MNALHGLSAWNNACELAVQSCSAVRDCGDQNFRDEITLACPLRAFEHCRRLRTGFEKAVRALSEDGQEFVRRTSHPTLHRGSTRSDHGAEIHRIDAEFDGDHPHAPRIDRVVRRGRRSGGYAATKFRRKSIESLAFSRREICTKLSVPAWGIV